MTSTRFNSLAFEPVSAPAPWHAYQCKLAFPFTPEHRALAVTLTNRLSQAAEHLHHLHPSIWLDTAELHRDGGSRLFSAHVRQWSPRMGFAMDPTGPPPRTLEFSDLAEATFGTPPKIFDRSAIFVSSLQATQSAYDLLAGRGLATLLFFPGDAPASPDISLSIKNFMLNSRHTLEPMVESTMFRNHSFYLPLLSSNSVGKATAQQLEAWLGGAELLWRESFEDGELLLLSTHDLSPMLEAAGLSPASQARGPKPWVFSPESLPQPTSEKKL